MRSARRSSQGLAQRARRAVGGAIGGAGQGLVRLYAGGPELSDLSGDRSHPIRFGSDELSGYSSELIATLNAFRRRLWLFRSVVLLCRTLLLALAVAFVFRALDLAGTLAEPEWLPFLIALVVAVGGALAIAQHVSYLEVARVVDRQLGLKAQLGTAVELTLEGEASRLARSQVRQATTIARRLSVRQAVSPRTPWGDLRLAGLAVAGLVALTLLGSAGLRAPQPDVLSQSALEALDPSMSPWYELDPAMAAELSQNGRNATGLQATVDRLRDQLERNEISPLEYQQQVAAVEDAIRQQAEDSARQQAALADLAESLADTSSTRGVADSLNRGNFGDAAKQLGELAGQTDRLSEQARQDLADRLAEAARNTAPSNEALSQAAERASEALRAGDKAGAEQALNDLASQVAAASEQVSPQSDLGDALEEAQAAQGGESGEGGEAQPGAAEGSAAQGDPSGDGQGQPGEGGAMAPSSGPSQAEGAPGGSGAGTGRGEKITTAESPSQPLKPDVGGNTLRISGKSSESGSRVVGESPTNAPVTSPSSGTTTIQSTGTRSSEQVTAVGEVNNVPLDLRSIVRDYFTGSDQP